MKYTLNEHEGIISFTGQDACTFLQGQTTCDVNTLTSENVLLGAMCNPKGRVITVFYMFKANDAFYMLLPSDQIDGLIKRLKMFVFRSNVIIENTSASYHIIGSDDPSDNSPTNTLRQFKLAKTSALSINVVSKSDSPTPAASDAINLWYSAFNAEGRVRITAVTREQFIPQMLNLDLLNAISFKKGCYTGQEIIARLHYKGTSKRRLYLFSSEHFMAPGTDLVTEPAKHNIGTIVDCQRLNNVFQGTAVIKTETVIDQPLLLANQHTIKLMKPPYL